MRLDELRELARLYSIQVTYEDAAGKKRQMSQEQLLAALKMRVPEGLDLREARRAREEQYWSRIVEPVTVVWGKRKPEIDLRLTDKLLDRSIDWQLTLEDGSTAAGVVPPAGKPLVTIVLPDPLPMGYHVLRLMIGQELRETFIIAAPAKVHPWNGRSWGVLLPLNAARTERSWGSGDLGDLQAYRSWIKELGGDVVATLPLLAAFDEEPSPYSPVSRLFWNETYLDLPRLPEFDSRDVDPFAIEQPGEKRRVLEKMAARFKPDDDFRKFAMKGAYGYAHFRAAREDKPSADYHLYVQYRMAQQMAEASDLYLDFPLGVHAEGFDAWKYADVFAKGASVGAPPDSFFTRGQNWGFPPLDPDAIRDRRYHYFRECIRHHVSHATILRIDHVMGLHRLFWIPAGGEPRDGVYVRYPENELYAVLTVESRRHQCAIVGEDLGTVPQSVPRMMTKHGLRRMYVLQYEVKPDGTQPLPTPAKESVASINTHDMPTFAAFWTGKDVDDRQQQNLLDEKGGWEERRKRQQMRDSVMATLTARGLLHDVLRALLRFLAGSPAEIVLVNLEDLWLEETPQNVPGQPDRSWRNRFRYTLEQMREMPEVVDTLRMIDRERRETDGQTT